MSSCRATNANLKDILATERAADVQLVKEAEERGRASEREDVVTWLRAEHAAESFGSPGFFARILEEKGPSK